MKADKVRALIDALVEETAPVRGVMHDWPASPDKRRKALAAAFRAGVRSAGMRFLSDAKLWEICGVSE